MKYEEPNKTLPEEKWAYGDGEASDLEQKEWEKTSRAKWSHEIEERTHLITPDFMERNKLLIASISKFMSQGNINKHSTIKLLRLKWMNLIIEMDSGLDDLAETDMIEILREIQMSRATGGFAARLDVTRRIEQQVKSLTPEKKRGVLSSFIGGRRREEETEETEDMY